MVFGLPLSHKKIWKGKGKKMKLKIDGKEYSIKFGYKPTLKERIISKVVRLQNVHGEDGEIDFEKIEDMMLFLPEFLLVGLQVHHKDFRYNYDTGEGKEKQLDKAFELVEKYMDEDNEGGTSMFDALTEALTQDSFLSNLFQKEQKEVEEVEEKIEKPKLEVVKS